jgi:hypothetical protein
MQRNLRWTGVRIPANPEPHGVFMAVPPFQSRLSSLQRVTGTAAFSPHQSRSTQTSRWAEAVVTTAAISPLAGQTTPESSTRRSLAGRT